ncbi:hypothetical protein AB3S75_021923 [Citrus x aurantiifolia]
MKRRDPKDDGIMDGSKSNTIGKNKKKKKKKKNIQRLGGTALSLEAFANAKSTNQHHNPAFKKKQREFYKNAKYVSKYRKSLKQHTSQQNDASSSAKPAQDENETEDGGEMNISLKKKKKKKQSLEELYEKKHEEEERARRERDAIFQAKKEEREKAEAQRKEFRSKMFKKTRHGQPVMKYRIEHLLQTIQGSSKKTQLKTIGNSAFRCCTFSKSGD